MRGQQHTLARPVELQGVGLHTGRPVHVRLMPAPEGSGIRFRRTDRAGEPIPARVEEVTGSTGSVSLGGPRGVRTVEHFLSAFWALGVDNLEVEVSGEELPGLDGSSLPIVQALRRAGLRAQDAPQHLLVVREPVWVGEDGAWVVALPAREFSATCVVTLNPPGPGDQAATYDPRRDLYEETIAPARTWGYERDAASLWAQGRALGASLENTLVIGGTGFLNPPRFPNEPARHKVVDLLGDLALLGCRIAGAVIAVRAGHGLHIALARALRAREG